MTRALLLLLCLRADAADLARYFAGIEGTFVLLDGRTGAYTRYNAARAARRFPPCSTFKIPNTAIALETGVAPDPDFTLTYDPALKIENPQWARDHNLRTAFRDSVVWYYQEMARRAGAGAESRFVRQFGYGNQDTSGPVDRFWLGQPLRISADEQVRFLQRLHDGKLGLSARTTRLTGEIMLADQGAGWKLRAKTGACRAEGEDVALWYVGWVEKDGGVSYFALEMSAKEYAPLWTERVPKARGILTELGVLPAQR